MFCCKEPYQMASEGISCRTRNKTQGASKRKLPCDDAETVSVSTNKKALLSNDDNKLNETISSGNVLHIRDILENKEKKVSTSCLHNALLKAVESGKKQVVRLLLGHGLSVKGNSKIGCLALISAAKHGCLDIVKTLIWKGVNADGKDSSGKTALITAVENNGCSALISCLLEKGKANVNLQDNNGKTALMVAVEQWDYETVQILFWGDNTEYLRDYKCDENLKDIQGYTASDYAEMNGSADLLRVLSESRKEYCPPLAVAAEWKDINLVRRFVENNPSCVESLNFADQPLQSAMHGLEGDLDTWDGKIHCSYELIEFLIQAGVDVDDCHGCGLTPLMFAASAGSAETVQLLLLHKADVDKVSDELYDQEQFKRRTALMMAAQNGHAKIVEMLIQAGAKLNKKDKDGETAFSLAVKGNHRGCVETLLKKQTLLSTADAEMMAKHEMLDLLTDVKHRWNKLFRDSVLQNVLCKAVKMNCNQLVRSLIEHDADVKVSNFEKRATINSASDIADMPALLEKLKANVNVKSNEGKTKSRNKSQAQNGKLSCSPSTIAAKWKDLNLTRLLVKDNPSCVKSPSFLDQPLQSAMHGLEGNQDIWDGKIHCSYELIEFLIQAGVDVDDCHRCGLTPLMFAASAGSAETVQLLLLHKVDVNKSSYEAINQNYFKGRTALMMAAHNGYAKIVEILTEVGAKLSKQDKDGETAFSLAVKGNHKACVAALLKKQTLLSTADAELMAQHEMLDLLTDVKHRWNKLFRDSVLQNVLCKAVETRCSQLVRLLIEHGVNVNFSDDKHLHPINIALDDKDMLALLVNLGANINFKSNGGITALLNAASEANKTHVLNLLQCNADMYVEALGHSALSLACMKGHDEIFLALVDNGIDLNYAYSFGSALWLCVKSRNYNALETLIKYGANVNFASVRGNTALMLAVQLCPLRFSELIIKSGADVNASDEDGNTALFHALRTYLEPEEMEEKVSLLLQHGANVNHVNLSMKTPLLIAVELDSQYNNVFIVLLNFQPDLDIRDKNEATAVHLALKEGRDIKLGMRARKGADPNIVNSHNYSPLMTAFRSMNFFRVEALVRYGAVINPENSHNVRMQWESDFDGFLYSCSRIGCIGQSLFLRCAEALFENTRSLHEARPPNLDLFLLFLIRENESRLISLLIKYGMGPNVFFVSQLELNFPSFYHDFIQHLFSGNFKVTPMCLAVMTKQLNNIALFAQTCFFHQEDVKMLQRPFVKRKLEQMFVGQPNLGTNNLSLDDFCPEKWSLRQWSKLAVLRAVGYGEGREQRVRNLPIPRKLHNELLYKNVYF